MLPMKIKHGVVFPMNVSIEVQSVCFFVMIRRPPRSTQSSSSAASDVYKRQDLSDTGKGMSTSQFKQVFEPGYTTKKRGWGLGLLSLIHISEPTRPY